MSSDEYIKVFKALGNQTRFKIFQLLIDNKLCACEILKFLSISQPTLSHHMDVLSDAKIVFSEIKGKWTYYELNKEVFQDVINLFNKVNKPVLTNETIERKSDDYE